MADRAIIFDCDGVLVDSEALVIEIEVEILAEAGFPTTADELAEQYTGVSYPTMLARLAERHGRPVPGDVAERLRQIAFDEFPRRLTAVPGIESVLTASDRPRCVASSSDVDRIELSLRVTGLDRHFRPDRVFSSQMVPNGKPAPDLFLLAAERLGVDPAQCLVVEDSAAGVAAAVAARMPVVGLLAASHVRPGLGDRLREAGADHLFDTAAALGEFLAEP